MKISAVICEFSPFHYGHEYLLKKIKEDSDAVIAIMSGGFTERGEVGIMSKYRRAHAAVLGGADLVLELPFPFSASGAEKFALGGVGVADALGCVDELAFGSECADTAMITEAAYRLSQNEFKRALADNIKNGRGEQYGSVYFDTYRALYGDTPLFNGSNDILALAYARRLVELGSKIKLRAIKRVGKSFSGEGGGFLSATELRREILSGRDVSALVPDYSAKLIADAEADGDIFDTERLFAPLAAIFRVCDMPEAANAYECNDELYSRIKRAFADSRSFSEAIEKAATKRYSPSHVRRAVIFAATGVSGWNVQNVTYTQVLAANAVGCEILKSLKKTSKIDIITKPADYSSSAYVLAGKADALLMLARRRVGTAGENMTKSPVIIQNKSSSFGQE